MADAHDHPHDHQARATGTPQARQREGFSLANSIGGWRGVLDGGLPSVAFILVFTLVKQVDTAAWTAVGVAAVLTVVRLVRRETLQHAIGGFAGVAICAFVAVRSGEAENFYLPGLFVNVAYGGAFVISILVRWPLLGLLVGTLVGDTAGWRRDPQRLRIYTLASAVWVLMFGLRLAVQLPLYLAGEVALLGTARVVMGLPLFLVTVYVSWLVLRRIPDVPDPMAVLRRGRR
ncbi:MAG: DUF3159 domain-containing protein [Carbonactinosporaceae bacterium]